VAHVVQLTLPRYLGCHSAGVLDVLVAVENFPNGARFIAHRIPKMDCKDE
jgi:hypothetical protein